MTRKQRSGVDRRQFMTAASVGGFAAAASTGIAAGSSPAAAETHADHDADVLVIGLGLGGLCAALRALEEGASVIAIDKAARTPSETEPDWEGRNLAKRAAIGGNFNLSGQVFHMQFANLTWPTDRIWGQIRGPNAHVGDPANAPVQARLVERAGFSINWLNDHFAGNADGVSIAGMDGEGNNTVLPAKDDPWAHWELRRKPGGVADYTNYGGYLGSMILLSKIEQAGGTVLEETAAAELLTDDDGQVVGARVRPADGGSSSVIRAKAVVIATGGFQKNKELMTRWIGPFAGNWIPSCIHTNTGDGHVMAMDVGAQMINLNTNYGEWSPYDARFNPDHIMSFSSPLVLDPDNFGVWVNEHGDRVFDEGGTRFYAADMMARSANANLRHMHIIDNDIYERPAVRATIDAMLEAGMTKSVFTADTLEGLAEATVAAADDHLRTDAGWLFSPRLADTVAEYNAAIEDGTAHKLSPPRTRSPRPIVTPPFWGIICLPGTGWTQGGPKINTDGAILGRDELPIGGLFGAGDVVTGNSMGRTLNSEGGYVGGLAPALIWGLVSGESAAAYAREQG